MVLMVIWINLITVHHYWICVFGKFIVRFSHLVVTMCVGAVLVELAFALLDPKLAELCLIVVVLDVHHLENQLSRQGIISMPFLGIPVSEMATIAFSTIARLIKVLTELSLVSVGQILQLFLGRKTSRIKAIVLLLQQRVS